MAHSSQKTGVAAILALAVAALFARAGTANAGGGCRGTPVTVGAGAAVAMSHICFVPTILYVEPGETVTWTNHGDPPHSVAGANVAWGNYTAYGDGQSVSHRFDRPGTYPYYCFEHNGMIAAVVVGDGKSEEAAGAVAAGQPPARNAAASASNAAPPPPSPAAARGANASEKGGSSVLSGAFGALAGAVVTAGGAGVLWRRRR